MARTKRSRQCPCDRLHRWRVPESSVDEKQDGDDGAVDEGNEGREWEKGRKGGGEAISSGSAVRVYTGECKISSTTSDKTPDICTHC
jgi:hypothetical protein